MDVRYLTYISTCFANYTMLVPFDSWYQYPTLPPCDVVYIESDYLTHTLLNIETGNLQQFLPFALLSHTSGSTTSSVKVMVASLLVEEVRRGKRGDAALTSLLLTHNLTIDWRLQTVTNTYSYIDNKKFDYHGMSIDGCILKA